MSDIGKVQCYQFFVLEQWNVCAPCVTGSVTNGIHVSFLLRAPLPSAASSAARAFRSAVRRALCHPVYPLTTLRRFCDPVPKSSHRCPRCRQSRAAALLNHWAPLEKPRPKRPLRRRISGCGPELSSAMKTCRPLPPSASLQSILAQWNTQATANGIETIVEEYACSSCFQHYFQYGAKTAPRDVSTRSLESGIDGSTLEKLQTDCKNTFSKEALRQDTVALSSIGSWSNWTPFTRNSRPQHTGNVRTSSRFRRPQLDSVT